MGIVYTRSVLPLSKFGFLFWNLVVEPFWVCSSTGNRDYEDVWTARWISFIASFTWRHWRCGLHARTSVIFKLIVGFFPFMRIVVKRVNTKKSHWMDKWTFCYVLVLTCIYKLYRQLSNKYMDCILNSTENGYYSSKCSRAISSQRSYLH